MPEIKNNFLKGKMNQDLDSRILPQGEYREAINLLISRSEGATVGEFENILGNTSVGTISTTQTLSVIGHFIDETNSRVYIFVTDFDDDDPFSRAPSSGTGSNQKIIEFDLNNPGSPNTLVSGYFLNLNKSFPIYGVNLLEELLFWTDNYNQPRRINITTARNNSSAYTKEMQISVAKYYPFDPLIPLERQTVTTGTSPDDTTIVLSTGNTNIKVGDIVTDNDKTDFTGLVIGNSTPPVKVTQIIDQAATTFKVSPAVSTGTVPSGTKLDFSRTSMKNQHAVNLSNHSQQTIDVIVNAGSGGTSSDRTGTPSVIRILDATTSGGTGPVLGGVPRVGDIITNVTSPNNIPNPTNPTANCDFNVRVASVNITNVAGDPSPDPGQWSITCDVDATFNGALTGFSATDVIQIAPNPDYNSSFSGDSKFLEDRFIRFSYRFKFNDNEYSLMAPFSQIMFIPKQYGQFGLGQIDTTLDGINNYYQDEVDAYNSTILNWFENDIDTIGLKIPLPDTLVNLSSIYNIKKIDILYKESDGQAIQVLDSIPINDIVAGDIETISWNDDQHGLSDQLYYDYSYESNKPYKTLPANQTIRVYDKVPIKALGQESIGNRIVYGNYTERMTPPSSINYEASYQDRDVQWSDYATEYPYHTVKQNRTYQVGFVLADKYGRQSDVILSTNDAKAGTKGSSVYVPYRSSGEASTSPVIDWWGTALTLRLYEALGEAINNTAGQPGLYREDKWVKSVSIISAGSAVYELNRTYPVTASGPGQSGTGMTVRVTGVTGGTPTVGSVSSVAIMTAGTGYVVGEDWLIEDGVGIDAEINIDEVGEANPLGWYSYKVVVKQQQQEYYNCFFPGFINGLPINDKIWNKVPRNTAIPTSPGSDPIETYRGKMFFASLLTENINKIPRALVEIGPTDTEYNSDEQLYIRINNPNASSSAGVRNLQYYPGQLVQDVLNIATIRDTELQSIPFVPFSISPDPNSVAPIPVGTAGGYVYNGSYPAGDQGEYGSTVRYAPTGTDAAAGIAVKTPTGSIPWGDVADKAPFFQGDEDPFTIKVDQVGNYDNPVGAIVCGGPLFTAVPHDSNYAGGTRTMQPSLSVAETKPVFSRLDIFWESTQSGKLEELNSAINSNDNAAVGLTSTTGSFAESTGVSTSIGPAFKFLDGSGAVMSNIVGAPTITNVYRQNDISKTNISPAPFSVATVIANTEYQIQTGATAADSTFWYGVNSNNTPSSDVYIFDLQVESTASPTNDIRNIPAALTLTLTNVIPCIKHTSVSGTAISTGCGGSGAYDLTAAGVGPTVEATNIVQLYGTNGSVRSTDSDYTQDLVWKLGSIIPGKLGSLSDFSIDSTGLITSNTIMTAFGNYGLTVTLTDVNDTGSNKLTATANIVWVAGAEYAPKIIGTGNTLAGSPGVMPYDKKGEWRFTNDTYSLGTATAIGYPTGWSTATWVYNSQVEYNTDFGTSCRADLFQGAITIKPIFKNTSTAPGDASIFYTIQYRANSGVTWTNIDTAAGSTDTWAATDPYKQFTRATTGAGQEDATYKFDQIGEYRVVTTQPSGSGASVMTFTVDFQDGNQAGAPPFVSGPCTP